MFGAFTDTANEVKAVNAFAAYVVEVLNSCELWLKTEY